MNKFLISGSSGFVGKNLINYLKNNMTCELFGLNTKCNVQHNLNKNFVWNELSSLKNMDVYIHLAGKAHDLKKTSSSEEYYKVNTDLTKSFFDTFIKSKAETFIYLSSVKAVADSVDGELKENHAPKPITDYGKSKLLAEEYIQSKGNLYDKRVYILRPCMIHGPGNKGNLNLLFKLIYKGVPWPLGCFNNKRSFCSIDNLLFVINELINNRNIPSGIYNISDDQPLSTNEIISLINKTQNKKSSIWNVPKSIIYLLARVGDKIKLPLNSENLKKLTESYLVSNNKLKDSLGKTFPVKSKDGMIKTFESFNVN